MIRVARICSAIRYRCRRETADTGGQLVEHDAEREDVAPAIETAIGAHLLG
jgi:hypothetical protein